MQINIDPVATAGLIAREVRSGTRDGSPTRIAVARRTYRTDQADLWDAITNPDRLPRWFLPISGNLEVGGRYQLEGNAGGVIERCDAPTSFAVTWEFGGGMSWLTVTLAPNGEDTTLELVHEAPVDPDMWDQFGPGAVGVGWDLTLLGLGLHLDSGEAVDEAEFNAWNAAPNGAAFVRRSAAGWADAAIGDGDEPAAAHEAADRTVTFFTVQPDGSSPDDAPGT